MHGVRRAPFRWGIKNMNLDRAVADNRDALLGPGSPVRIGAWTCYQFGRQIEFEATGIADRGRNRDTIHSNQRG